MCGNSATQSANLFEAQTWNGSTATNQVTIGSGGALSTAQDITVNSLRVGRGAAGIDTNTALGVSALNNAATTGGDNTALGRGVLQSATSGAANAGLGTWTLTHLTTGHTNTAVGAVTRLRDMGIETRWFDPLDPQAFAAAACERTRAVLLESPGSLTMEATARTYRYLDAAEVAEQQRAAAEAKKKAAGAKK